MQKLVQSRTQSFKKYMTILTRAGDRMGIITGGWGKYVTSLEEFSGKVVPKKIIELRQFIAENPEAHRKAILEFEAAGQRTQQATQIENLPELMRLGSFADWFTLFQTAPTAQFNNTISTLRALGFFGDPRRIPTGEGLKRLLIYLVLIPGGLQFMADGFQLRPRRQAAAIGASVLTLGYSNYPLFLGELAVGTARRIAGLPAFDIGEPAPASILNDLGQAIGTHGKKLLNEITMEEILDTVKDIAIVLASLKGIPAKPASRITEGAIDFVTNEDERDIRRFFGFSEFALGEQGTEKRKQKPFGVPAEDGFGEFPEFPDFPKFPEFPKFPGL